MHDRAPHTHATPQRTAPSCKPEPPAQTSPPADKGRLTPAAVTALQRAAGNTAVMRALSVGAAAPVQRRKPSANAPTEHYAGKAEQHPEWPVFQSLMQTAGCTEAETETAWQLILGGLREQSDLNQQSADPSLSKQSASKLRASNTWFKELVAFLGHKLKIGQGSMALWSGGFDTSKYAKSKGHTPLEFSPLGAVVDQLELHSDWRLQGKLWNALSVAYVSHATGPVHVFMRAYDPTSVLVKQEIPQLRKLQKLNPNVELVWHPLYTTPDGKIHEITPDLRLADDAQYTSRDKCVAAMYTYLLRMHDESNDQAGPAYKDMTNRLSANVNAKA
ncbi:hypothetical protein [Streptomyces sp. NPDC042319]|uniref:hypothetical protein n=1 Tax=Streptomyces sp. NPDC042319 TaxID=3154332 RepID=UPI00340E4B77